MGQYLSTPLPASLEIEAISKAEKKAKRAKAFLLRNAGIPVCPRRLPLMTALKEVDLSYNRMTELPFEIGALVKMRTMNVSHNRLSHLPDSLGSCILLKDLNAAHNTLEQIPDSIGQLLRLESADFSGLSKRFYSCCSYDDFSSTW
jgi:Leucine-rich repeat (LRR) protein